MNIYINYRGHRYRIYLWHRIIPMSIVRVVQKFNKETEGHSLLINGDRLSGKVALVTGAHKGIGFAIAKRLLQDGANVIITGRNEEQLKKAVEKLKTPNVAYIQWDISDINNCTTYYDKAEKIYGPINILVNNAGVTSDRGIRLPFEEMDQKHYHYVHGINTLGTRMMCIRYAERYSEGTILNILSNTSLLPAKDAYYTSKWAIRSFTSEFGKECISKGKKITVNGLCPGPVKTDMSFDEHTSLYRKEIPNHRIGLPREIAELAFVMVLSGLKGQNGKITVCDGGESLN